MNFGFGSLRNIAFWILIIVGLMAVQALFAPRPQTPACFGNHGQLAGATIAKDKPTQACTIDESQLKELVQKGDKSIVSLMFQGNTVGANLENGWTGVTTVGGEYDATLIKQLADNSKPAVPYKQLSAPAPGWAESLIGWLPLLLLLALPFIITRLQSGGIGGLMGKSKATLTMPGTPGSATFKDVAGIDEAKADCVEVVDFLKDPKKYTQLGGRLPHGLLLVGPPGTGKTLLAKAIAGEANVPFLSISGSDFVEMFVGVGAARVRALFDQAKKLAPCIIFIDEIDALGRHRGAGMGGGHDEKEQTLNQLLVQLSGFDTRDGIILIGATNRPDVLDPALLRSGRFDRQIVVPNPDVDGRELIIGVHIRRQNVPVVADLNRKHIAQITSGFSGADIENMVNEAALFAARRGKKLVDQNDFESAVEKMMLGAERRSLVMSEDELWLVCYHEAGHAITSLHVKGADPLTKVTRVPRGRALGVTLMQPERDRLSQSLGLCKARLAVAMGGRAAEMLFYKADKDDVTGGASGDIDYATKIATAMVTEWGFSEKAGPIKYTDNSGNPFLGMAMTQQSTLSEKYKVIIDDEKKRFVNGGLTTAHTLLEKVWDEVEALANKLYTDETLNRKQVDELLAEVRAKRPAAAAAGEPTAVEPANHGHDAAAHEATACDTTCDGTTCHTTHGKDGSGESKPPVE
jgi:cell division protease FtsH